MAKVILIILLGSLGEPRNNTSFEFRQTVQLDISF